MVAENGQCFSVFPALPHRTLIANCLRTAWTTAKALARAARLAAVIAEPLNLARSPPAQGEGH